MRDEDRHFDAGSFTIDEKFGFEIEACEARLLMRDESL